jgi:hypothetical protein
MSSFVLELVLQCQQRECGAADGECGRRTTSDRTQCASACSLN